MTQKKDKDDEEERCPNCDMPLEDIEVCNYCEWKRIDSIIPEGGE